MQSQSLITDQTYLPGLEKLDTNPQCDVWFNNDYHICSKMPTAENSASIIYNDDTFMG
jgi:hypothetical protein